MKVVRSMLSIVVGAIAAMIVITAIHVANAKIHSPGVQLDPFKDPEGFAKYIADAPAGMFLLLILAYAAGSFVGGCVAGLIAPGRRIVHGMIIGVLLLLAGIANFASMPPHPLWVVILCLLIFLPMAYVGARVACGIRGAA